MESQRAPTTAASATASPTTAAATTTATTTADGATDEYIQLLNALRAREQSRAQLATDGGDADGGETSAETRRNPPTQVKKAGLFAGISITNCVYPTMFVIPAVILIVLFVVMRISLITRIFGIFLVLLLLVVFYLQYREINIVSWVKSLGKEKK